MDVREKLVELLRYVQYLGGLEEKIADHLIENGVTVQEWVSVKEPPKEKGTYIVCTDNCGVLFWFWYGTAWNAGGGATKHIAYWMERPQPPKGE